MKNLKIILFIITTLAGLIACNKTNNVEFIPTDKTIISIGDTIWNELDAINALSATVIPELNIEKIVKDLAKDPIQDVITAEQNNRIISPRNITVEIPANSLALTNGRTVTGEVNVKIFPLKSKGDVILQGLSTVSDNKNSISGGVILIKALKNGQELTLAKNKVCSLRIVSAERPDSNHSFFEGEESGRFKFDWINLKLGNGSGATPTLSTWSGTVTGTTDTLKGYDLVLDRLKPIIWARNFETSTPLLNTLKVKVGDNTYTNANTSTYVVAQDGFSVVKMQGNVKTRLFEFAPTFKGLPTGQRVTIVTISFIKGKYFLGLKDTTIVAGQTTINMSTFDRSKAQVIDSLSRL